MSEWKTYRWGDLITLEYGKSLRDYRSGIGEIPVYGTNGLIGFTNTVLCAFPSIIIGRKGAYRGVHYSSTPFFVIDTAYYLNPIVDYIDTKFCYYYLLTFDINGMDSGSAIPSTSRQEFYQLKATIPDLPTQTAIASILSSLDDKIELNLQMNQTLETMAQAIFKAWFVDFNFPGFDGELVDGLPKGWRMGKLSDTCKIEIGRTPPRMEEYWFSTDPKDIKWISIRDLGIAGVYIFKTHEYLTKEAVEKFRISVIPENTVVLSFKLTVGRLAITTENMLSNEAIAQIKSNIFSTEYIYTYLKTYNWESLGSTSSIATAINSKIIKEMEILIPENKVEKQFQEVIKPIFAKLKVNSQEIQTLTQIRDTLLPKLMTGQITVQP